MHSSHSFYATHIHTHTHMHTCIHNTNTRLRTWQTTVLQSHRWIHQWFRARVVGGELFSSLSHSSLAQTKARWSWTVAKAPYGLSVYCYWWCDYSCSLTWVALQMEGATEDVTEDGSTVTQVKSSMCWPDSSSHSYYFSHIHSAVAHSEFVCVCACVCVVVSCVWCCSCCVFCVCVCDLFLFLHTHTHTHTHTHAHIHKHATEDMWRVYSHTGESIDVYDTYDSMQMLPLSAATSGKHRRRQCLLTLARSLKTLLGSVPSACVLAFSLYMNRLCMHASSHSFFPSHTQYTHTHMHAYTNTRRRRWPRTGLQSHRWNC